jgi:hypothetical protein
MTSTPTQQNIRLTISVTPEVHATFKRLADASGMSIMVEKAREAPRQVVKEMHAMSLGTADLLSGLLSDLRTGKKALPPERAGGRPAAGPASPRPVIRGDKSPQGTARRPRGAK